jgi:hypothetical protein
MMRDLIQFAKAGAPGRKTEMTPNEALAAIINEWPHSVVTSKICEAYRVLRSHIEASQPWLPPQQEGFRPWIEWKPGDLGPHVNDTVVILLQKMREAKAGPKLIHTNLAQAFPWVDGPNLIVAYCVKLPDADGKFAGRKNAFENGCGNG